MPALGDAMTENDVLLDPSSSDWLRDALRSALRCDPVTVANDAALLMRLLHDRLGRLAEVDELVTQNVPALQ